MMGAHFHRSGETISRQFHACLLAILKLHVVLLKKPTPIREDCDDERWKYFKNCLGALDGTMILVNVPCDDRPKYRTRKGTIAMNVLGVCSPEMEFTYVLPGWEGSAHDCRILRDAISRPNGLKVPKESSASGGGRGRNKRFWTAQEDEVLVEALSELAVDPHWRCENGFRSGYMVRLEEVIGKALPGCGLKATPHIDSRIKTLGAKFRAISQMLNTSGFSHPNCKNLYGISFPHFHELEKIYGKDYATGKPAEGFADAVNNLEKVAPPQVTLDSSDDEDVLGSGNVTQTVTSPPYKKIKTENTTKKSKRGSGGAGSSNELASLQAFMKDMNVHLSTMATVMARTDDREQRADEREQKLVEKSEQVLEELLSFNLEGVTPTQVFEVANILTAQPNKLMIFSKCPDALKGAYVKSLLGGSGDGSA
uniref:DDE Tnp4 domain-containing protein n=1 Tax=Chenopodium quinoa TaxID=63459 RepID=A0A803N970_CHEQI